MKEAEIREERWQFQNPEQAARRILGIDDTKWEAYVERHEMDDYPENSIRQFAPRGVLQPENESDPDAIRIHRILTTTVKKQFEEAARRKLMEESKFRVKYPDEEGNPLTYTTRHGLMKSHLSYKTQLPGIPNISLPYVDPHIVWIAVCMCMFVPGRYNFLKIERDQKRGHGEGYPDIR